MALESLSGSNTEPDANTIDERGLLIEDAQEGPGRALTVRASVWDSVRQLSPGFIVLPWNTSESMIPHGN